MKILGICGSPRKSNISCTYAVMELILKSSDCEYELVPLAGLKFSGCTACMGCAKDNVCKVNDDLAPLRSKILEADAFIFGSPNYFSGISSLLHCFLERFYQFRHQGSTLVWGKLAVAVGVGSMGGIAVAEQIEKFMAYSFIKTTHKLSINGHPSCFYCGYGKNCPVGVPALTGTKCPDSIPPLLDNHEIREDAIRTGKEFGEMLKKGYDRALTAVEMQEFLMDKLREI